MRSSAHYIVFYFSDPRENKNFVFSRTKIVLLASILVYIYYSPIIRLGSKFKTSYEFVICALVFYDKSYNLYASYDKILKCSHITEKLKNRKNINEQTHIVIICESDNKQIYIILLNVNLPC